VIFELLHGQFDPGVANHAVGAHVVNQVFQHVKNCRLGEME
jgi:hypothetical protein